MSILKDFTASENGQKQYFTKNGLQIIRTQKLLDPTGAAKQVDTVVKGIDSKKGALFSSSYEYPGRYSRWDMGFVNPPIELSSFKDSFKIRALNNRGKLLLQYLNDHLSSFEGICITLEKDIELNGKITASQRIFSEEIRSKQPSIFTLIKYIMSLFFSQEDSFLGFYGAFGYDLIFQFDPIEQKHKRNENQNDLLLYIPDEILIVDHRLSTAYQLQYEFSYKTYNTNELARDQLYFQDEQPASKIKPKAYVDGKYADLVRTATQSFKKGDLFEVVPTQCFYEKCTDQPSDVFMRLQQINPSPYGFIINLGGEYLVGSSPEMYVRVEGKRVETCPISGTIKRGRNALEDAEQILKLLNSKKDESELTMCTDVDRNDKSRICIPGTVKVIGRRQPEIYSHLIHTVDHIEGQLKPNFDSLDAFITHMWAVTITGAPKRAAAKWIEQHEEAPRKWYGGAVGHISFNGDINTGLTLRTIYMQENQAEIRVGATLLYDSIPEEEEKETQLKAQALKKAIRGDIRRAGGEKCPENNVFSSKRILLVDHEDSFVHTLANYLRQFGADVITMRYKYALEVLKEKNFDLVFLSPGPGLPSEFMTSETIHLCISKHIPIFGVCLGLQAIVEYFGGSLDVLEEPRHGRKRSIHLKGTSKIFEGVPHQFEAGLYHSIFAQSISEDLRVTAISEEGIVMAIEHRNLPIAAIQFHPESIMSAHDQVGLTIIKNVIHYIK
ncbi:anthranilate synthase component I [Bacillus inaquosorum]|nr:MULTISPECIES: anthranilate synthase component I [Bacillus]MCY7776068.1 anthranilate synthase component I [Bacillus licheniformis]MCY7787290.1 anthranilate synthase component I [Bacillus inaquosorum]MCY8020991.1 anthranilate synthase component I [Bacillus licheniformis]MCY8076266.1 anthranilate synthase component I [Bacillus haynesii]MCY8086012.1 anthranilate synthase component I [Bacillus inaquosorum]